MPLDSLTELLPSLCCPRCRSSLRPTNGSLNCTSTGCALAKSAFPVIAGLPVLVDFEVSIVAEQSVTTAIAPNAAAGSQEGVRGLSSRWQRPVNSVATANLDQLLEHLAEEVAGRQPRILVVGGASVGNGIERIYTQPDLRIVAFDVAPSHHCQLVADGHQIPFKDATFDAVIVQAVLEHVLDPRRVVQEIHRVLDERGIVYAETPFMQQVHEGPFDFHRFTHSGHRWLFRDFSELSSGAVAGPGTALQWAIDYALRAQTGSRRLGIRSRLATWPLARLDARLSRERSLDAACALYFLGRRATSAMSAPELVSYYAGAQRQ